MNPVPTKPVVMEDIARVAGVHRSTVSLSLRNHSSIPIGTRKRIQTLAQKLGYRPDPLLSSFNAQTIQRRHRIAARTLAFVHDLPTREAFTTSPKHQELLQGASERAGQFGSRFEVFHLSSTGLSPSRLDQVLEARGITGVLLAALDPAKPFPELACESYAALGIDTSHGTPRVDTLVPNYRESARRCVQELQKRGCRKIVLLHTPRVPRDIQESLNAGLLGARPAEPLRTVVMYPWKHDDVSQRRKHAHFSCDGLILCGVAPGTLPAALAKLPLVSLDFEESVVERPGIRRWYLDLGRVAFDLLMERLQLNVSGLPQCPVTLEYLLPWDFA